MVAGQKAALQTLWKDRCNVFRKVKQTDETTHLTDWTEQPLLSNLPCKLSFESLKSAEGDPVSAVEQSVKLFLSNDIEIPTGSKIEVIRDGKSYLYKHSGKAGIFSNHQEIYLTLFDGWA